MATPSYISPFAFNSASATTLGLGTIPNDTSLIGQYVFAQAVMERGSTIAVPVISGGSTPWTVLNSEQATNYALTVVYKVIASGDLNQAVTATTTAGRRMVGHFEVVPGSGTPVIATKTVANFNDPTVTFPPVTPTGNNATILAIGATSAGIMPGGAISWGTHGPGYVEMRKGESQSTTGGNAAMISAYRSITGGAGVSQTGDATDTTAPATIEYMAWSIALNGPVAAAASAGPDQTAIEPGATVTLTGTGTGTWSQTGGTPTVTLGGSGNTRTFVAPYTVNGTTLTFSFGGDTMTVTVLRATRLVVVTGGANPTFRPLETLIV